MYWYLVFSLIFFCIAPTKEQRRAVVYYPATPSEESEPVSENPLSSSINSIQTGREELIGYHRGDTGPGGTYRRGYHKTTTPDYFKDSVPKGDSLNTGKVQQGTESTESDAKTNGNNNPDGDKLEGSKSIVAPAEDRRDGHSLVPKDKRSSGFESPSSTTVRPPGRNPSGAESSSQGKDRTKESMDISKGASVRDQDRRINSQESRRQSTTPSSALNARFNTTVREGSDRNRDELSEKSRNERINRERRPGGSTENPRGQRTGTRTPSDKGQILTHVPASRIPGTQRYDRTENASSSNERKALERPLDGRDSFRNVGDEKKDLDGEPNLRGTIYPIENEGMNSTVINKPTHLLIGEERPAKASRNPDIYPDGFTGGNKDDLNVKVGSDIEKPSADGKIYAERPYVRDGEDERSPGHRGRDVVREYPRRHRDDRYDGQPYDERGPKDGQAGGDRVKNTGYNPQDRSSSRSSRPTDLPYHDEYRDDGYEYRDVTKDGDNIRKDGTRSGRRPYTSASDDVDDRDRYEGDGTRSYRDYSDDRRYRDERIPVDRDGTRRYKDEDTRKYRDDGSRIYDDYDGTDRYRDDYNPRYDKDGESKRYGDSSTRRYTGSGSRKYDDDESRSSSEYDRPVRRYKDESEYVYNDTQRYKDDYDGYRGDYRRGSGESGSSRRYDEKDGTRGSRYDDEDYKDSRSYSTRDNERRYTSRDSESSLRQRNPTRKYTADEARRYRGDDEDDRRYRDETRVYGDSSPRDKYDQDNRRTYDRGGDSPYVEPPLYQERSEINPRRQYDDMNRQRENNDSGRSRVDASYRHPPYEEDEYYDNRTSTANVNKYEESYRSRLRTGDDSSAFPASDGDNRKYASRSSTERRRDKDRIYPDTSSSSRRRVDSDDSRKDRSRVYDEDRYTDRSRVDSYDERVIRGRSDDEYVRSSTDRVRDYETRVYRDSDEEVDTRRARGDEDTNVRYGSDDRDRTADDEFRKTRSSGGRSRDKDYTGRRYEDRYRDESSDGTYGYREEDERYRYPSSEDRKEEYKDTERRNKGNQRFRDEYDAPYDREINIPRNTDERLIGSDRPNRREDRYRGSRGDFGENTPEKSSPKTDTTLRDDAKSESPSSRNEESLLKIEKTDPYDDERRGDGKSSQARDIQTNVRIPTTQYSSRSDDVSQKPSASEPRPDSLDKGDFARGRRTSFYNEEDKIDADRDDGSKSSRDDRRSSRVGESKESSFTRNEKSRGSTYETRDIRQGDRSSSRPNTEGRAYPSRRDNSDTARHKTRDDVPVSRVPSDLLPASDDPEYTDTAGDTAKSVVTQSGEDHQRRRYSSTSTYDRSSRRRLPSLREPDMERHSRRDDSEDSDNRGRYRYTKSRGDREDFSRDAPERSFVTADEYRGKSSVDDRRDMPKGEYGSPGAGTPTRSKDDRVPIGVQRGKDEYYPSSTSSTDKVPPRSGKAVDDTRPHRDFDRRDKIIRDHDSIGRDERGMYEKGDHPRSPSHDAEKFGEENTTRDHFETSSGEIRVNRESDPTFLVVSQAAAGVRGQGSTISRSATPIPNYPDKEFVIRNSSGRSISDKVPGAAINRDKRFQYDDRLITNTTSRSVTGMNDELSKRPLTTKEVIEAAYRHTDETEKQREIFYPVYVPGSGNMTSPDIIRPSERRGITTPTKKKKKK